MKNIQDIIAKITNRLESSLENMVEKSLRLQRLKNAVVQKKSEPTQKDFEEYIKDHATKAAVIAAGAALVPGPLGMLVLVKETQSVLQIQVDLIARLCLATKHEEEVTNEMVLQILATALGNVGINVAVTQGTRLIAEQMAKQTAKNISSRVLQKGGFSVLAKWIPFVGSGLMYKYTYKSTKELGEKVLKSLK